MTRKGYRRPHQDCMAPNCKRDTDSLGYCDMHYQRLVHGIPMNFTPQSYRTDGVKRCSVCLEEKSLESFNRHRATVDGRQVRCIECQSWMNIEKKYGVTRSEYMTVYARQNGLCATCSDAISVPGGGGRRKLVARLDHCHETGSPRGLLCHSCNSSIGLAKENAETLGRMLDYVKNGGTWKA